VFVAKLLAPTDLAQPTEGLNPTSTPAVGSERLEIDPAGALPEAAAAAETRPKQQDAALQGVSKAPAAAGDAGLLDYLPASRLSVPPKALRPREVPFPDEVTESTDVTVLVSLFIDETGKVRRIRLDDPHIPAPFAQSIISTFLSTDFAPGQIDSVPVRSVVRIEVGFQGGPTSR